MNELSSLYSFYIPTLKCIAIILGASFQIEPLFFVLNKIISSTEDHKHQMNLCVSLIHPDLEKQRMI